MDIKEEIQNLASNAPDFNPRPLSNPANKPIARSAFQKAIRRGNTDLALSMGEFLMDYDKSYAWYTLATVLIEDVGIGDFDLISYGCLTTLKSFQEQGSDPRFSHKLYASMVARACAAPKSRACCELSLGYEMILKHQQCNQLHFDEEVSVDALINELSGTDTVKLYEACVILRKKFRGMGLKSLTPALEQILNLIQDTSMSRACMLSFERTVDNMNLALFPIVRAMQSSKGSTLVKLEKDTWPESVIIGSVPSESYDMHTLLGGKSLSILWGKLKKDWPLLGDLEMSPPFEDWKKTKALGSLVFIVEGGLVDRRLSNWFLDDIKKYQDVNFAKGYGIMPVGGDGGSIEKDKHDLLEFCKKVKDSIPELNSIRQWCYEKSK